MIPRELDKTVKQADGYAERHRDVARWLLRCEDLARQWAVIRYEHAHDLARWQDRMAAMSSQEALLRDAGQWTHGRDDLLGVIWRQRDELTHSRMIGWLLDPCARHGFVPLLTILRMT